MEKMVGHEVSQYNIVNLPTYLKSSFFLKSQSWHNLQLFLSLNSFKIVLPLLLTQVLLSPFTQVSPEILTQGKNETKSTNQNKGNFEYLWVGKV